MLEWLKRHAWKACILQKGISGSNPDLSAEKQPVGVYRLLFYYDASINVSILLNNMQ